MTADDATAHCPPADRTGTATPAPALPFANLARPRVLSPSDRLEQARADLVRRGEVGALVTQARQALAAAREERAALALRLEDESADVERLEGASASSLWSRVRGRHQQDLARERDEQAQARADLAAAESRVAAVRAELDRLLEDTHELVDAGDREQAALEDLARGAGAWDGQDPERVAAAQLELRRRQALRDLDVAIGTATGLLRSLDDVSGMARWASFAAWRDARDHGAAFAKYRRLDEMRPHVQAVNDGLALLASQAVVLAVVTPGQLLPIEVPAVDRFLRAVDTWVDDPVTDHALWGDVQRMTTDIQYAREAVGNVVTELTRRRASVPSR